MHLEANRDRNMLAQVERLNAGIHVSDDERFVTLLVAEIDTRRRLIRYVNRGHNPALLFRASTATVTPLNSSCLPRRKLCARLGGTNVAFPKFRWDFRTYLLAK